jgi:hypothetical protein
VKVALTIFFCLFLGLSASAQPPEAVPEIKAEVGLEDIYLAKDNGEGRAGDEAKIFTTTDIPIYCVVHLTATRPAIVKMNFVAVKVQGVRPETKVVSVSYKTDGRQNRVNFTGSPDGDWVAGSYRVDIFIDGKLAGSRELEIQRSATDNPSIKSFQPKTAKPKAAPQRARKNNFTDR